LSGYLYGLLDFDLLQLSLILLAAACKRIDPIERIFWVVADYQSTLLKCSQVLAKILRSQDELVVVDELGPDFVREEFWG
jgi:hypothetical protein